MPTHLACPVHKTRLSSSLYCEHCNKTYGSVGNVPVLINDANSVFRCEDYIQPDSAYTGASGYAGSLDKRLGPRQLYRDFMKWLSESNPSPRAFTVLQALQHILRQLPDANILVIGAGETNYLGNCIYTDVAFGKNVTCIADAHDLPFEDGVFDACIAIAVLEHVADPQRCVSEIQRVLKLGGYVFAETPFMQPVHMGAYDFTRFTYLGHRRLFRYFTEITSGVAAGPAASTAQLMRYLLTSLSDHPVLGKALSAVGLLGAYPLRFLDRIALPNKRAYDSASGFYFFGTLNTSAISDRELLGFFRGG
jgi:SAM-dependent methyltransferase